MPSEHLMRHDAVLPKITDLLQPLGLTQAELSGEIGRRITDLIYQHFMVLDLDHDFVEPFQSRPFTEGYHYVGVGKVIDAGSLFAAYTGDPAVHARTAGLIANLLATRDADGYLGTFQPETDARQNHHNWVLHDQEYLLLGLLRHWQVTGDATSLQYARELGDYIITTFSKDPAPEEICTAGLPEAFLTLYRSTGDIQYLTFAAEIRHGNSTSEVQCASLRNWAQTLDTRPAHVYVMLARCYAQTELYRHDDTPSLLAMTAYIRHELLRKGGGLNVVGSASDGEYFSYTQNGAGAIGESCVTAYLLRWLNSLLRLEGDLRYGDIMERTIYNALFAAQEPTGRRLRYFTPFTGPRAYFNQDGFCCPGNFRRIMAELPQHVYYQCADGGIAVNLFTASTTSIALDADTSVTLTQETNYPTSGHVVLRVSPSRAVTFALRVRIPRWCRNATVTLNDTAPVAVSPGTNTYQMQRTWTAGDTVTIELPMSWRLVQGHQLQEGKVALLRGPVVYCLGTAENADVLAKFPNCNGVVIDPGSLGEPEPDASIRPDGMKVKATAWIEAEGAWSQGAPHDTVTFTEFIDPTGIMTYFHVLDLAGAVEDELVEVSALNSRNAM
jgi:DUF1680 family protein